MGRDHRSFQANLTNALGSTQEIDVAAWANGGFTLGPSSQITGITFYGCAYRDIAGGAKASAQGYGFGPLYDNTVSTPIAQVYTGLVAGAYVPFPDACFSCGNIKMVITAGSATDEVVDVSLKT